MITPLRLLSVPASILQNKIGSYEKLTLFFKVCEKCTMCVGAVLFMTLLLQIFQNFEKFSLDMNYCKINH